jgi:hypothetical protein
MSKTPTPRPEQRSTDDLVAESRRLQERLAAAAADLDAWTKVVRAALAAEAAEESR